MLRAISNNSEIDVIWEAAQEDLESLRQGRVEPSRRRTSWEEWEISPRCRGLTWSDEIKEPPRSVGGSDVSPVRRRSDASIAAKADFEYLYDKPYMRNGNKVSA